MAKTIDEARAGLLKVLPYIRHAVELAKQKGNARLGILCEFADGGGKVEARFDADFIEDVAALIGAPQTADDDLAVKARHFTDTLLRP